MRRSSRATRIGFALAASVATLAAITGSATGFQPVGSDDFRVSVIGADGDTDSGLTESFLDVVHNTKRNEYLALFAGDPVADGDFEILGQRISAAGARVGPTFPISNSGAGNDSFQPAAAYHPKRNEYLVTFQSDQLNGSDNEIYGQRLSATGTEIGGDFRISNAGDQGANHEADQPAIAFDSKRGSYLVAFESEGLATDGEQEIFAQRVSATGAQIGGDQRVSTVGADGDTNRDADFAGIAYNRKRDQFLVVFEANALSSPAEQEIFGQRLAGPGAPIGGIIGVSNAGPEGDPNYEAVSPTVAYGAKRDNYLVAFHGENFASPGAGEIFAQRISSAGVAQGGDVQVSFSGAATEIARLGGAAPASPTATSRVSSSSPGTARACPRSASRRSSASGSPPVGACSTGTCASRSRAPTGTPVGSRSSRPSARAPPRAAISRSGRPRTSPPTTSTRSSDGSPPRRAAAVAPRPSWGRPARTSSRERRSPT